MVCSCVCIRVNLKGGKSHFLIYWTLPFNVVYFGMSYSGEASWRNMGKVRRVLQQEEHYNVWWHWTKLPYEPTEWTKGRRRHFYDHLLFLCQFCFNARLLFFLYAIRSDPSWRPTWTERKTGSCINYPNTSKKSPSSMTSAVWTTNTGRGKGRLPSARINNTNSWIEPCCVCSANNITVTVQDCVRIAWGEAIRALGVKQL